MLNEFLTFVLDCFLMVVKLFQNTNIGGTSYMTLIVAACMLSIVLTSIVVRFRPSFRPPAPSKAPKVNDDKNRG